MKRKLLVCGLVLSALLAGCTEVPQTSSKNSEITSGESTIISQSESSNGGESKVSSESSNTQSSSKTASSDSSSSQSPSSSSSSKSSSNSSSTSVTPPPVDSRWNLDFTKTGKSFRDALASEIIKKGNKKSSYSSMLGIGASAAAYGGGSKFVPFYHTTDTLTTTGSCNREHVWPNSRGGGSDAGGTAIEQDPYCIRPTLNSENNSRSNYFYGTAGKSSKEWDPASCGFEGARGEAARVVLYIATKYGNSHCLRLTNTPGDANNLKTMGRLDRCMEWNAKYPVTDIEKQINNYLESQGFGRNPFVDHPEYANYIWNSQGMLDDNSGTGGGGGGQTTNYNYELVTDIDSIGSKEVVFVGTPDKANYYLMSKDYKAENLPWYYGVLYTEVKSDLSQMSYANNDMARFKFTKNSNGTYTIKEVNNNANLVSYISGTHYSIAIKLNSSNSSESFDNEWTLTKSDKGYIMQGTTSKTYLYCSDQSSFSGGSKVPSSPIYMYTAI